MMQMPKLRSLPMVAALAAVVYLTTPVVAGDYRANTDGSITPIVEDPTHAHFTLTGNFTHINDKGEVAFTALLDDPTAQFGFRFVVVRAEPLKGKSQ